MLYGINDRVAGCGLLTLYDPGGVHQGSESDEALGCVRTPTKSPQPLGGMRSAKGLGQASLGLASNLQRPETGSDRDKSKTRAEEVRNKTCFSPNLASQGLLSSSSWISSTNYFYTREINGPRIKKRRQPESIKPVQAVIPDLGE